jgi:hypothetical protein
LTAAKDFVIILAQGTRQQLEYIFYSTGRRFFTSNFYFALVLCTAKLHKNQTSYCLAWQPDINFVLLFCTGAMLQHC